jgi:hypothetical protein
VTVTVFKSGRVYYSAEALAADHGKIHIITGWLQAPYPSGFEKWAHSL